MALFLILRPVTVLYDSPGSDENSTIYGERGRGGIFLKRKSTPKNILLKEINFQLKFNVILIMACLDLLSNLIWG